MGPTRLTPASDTLTLDLRSISNELQRNDFRLDRTPEFARRAADALPGASLPSSPDHVTLRRLPWSGICMRPGWVTRPIASAPRCRSARCAERKRDRSDQGGGRYAVR